MDKGKAIEFVKENSIEFVRIQFVDINGNPKNIVIPATRLEEAFDDGVMFDGSSIAGYATIEESDYHARPDPESLILLPDNISKRPTVRFNCDIYDSAGDRYLGDPKFVLERVLERAGKRTLHVGPEAEFYLFKNDGTDKLIPHDSAGYFDLSHMDLAEDVRAEISTTLAHMGIKVHAAHHEVGKGQHEIDLCHTDAVTMADWVVSYKYVTKIIALGHGLHASFMPKPLHGAAGNGMHVHLSLADKTGVNLFYDGSRDDGLSDLARSFTAGVIDHIREITAILNPIVNSYKRLVPGYEAPTYISWAHMNRSAMVRIPPERGKRTRCELRSPDPSGNPYLQFAVILAAGLDGIEQGLEPPEMLERDLFALTFKERKELGIASLPDNLHHALDLLGESELARETLGEHVFHHFLKMKKKEWDQYRTMVTPWEIDRYYQVV